MIKTRFFALFFLLLPTAALADASSDVAKAFVKAVNKGEDVITTYPEAVTPREAASLQRLKGCSGSNFMKQGSDRYTVVWVCRGGTLGMEMTVSEGKLTSVKTFEVVSRPNVSR